MTIRLGIALALLGGLLLCADAAHADNVGIFDGQSPANSNAIASFLNSNGHTATNYLAGDINAANLAGLDVVILLRTSGNNDLTSWVNGGGKLITEWTSSDWAVNTANLIDASISGGGFVASPDTVTITAAGLAMGLGAGGMPNPYADDGRTDFFRNFSSVGAGAEVLATRSSGDEAIVGGASGAGYTLVWGYDWADWSESPNPNLDYTKQLLLNAIDMQAVPEPGSLALLGLGLAGFAVVRVRRKR